MYNKRWYKYVHAGIFQYYVSIYGLMIDIISLKFGVHMLKKEK